MPAPDEVTVRALPDMQAFATATIAPTRSATVDGAMLPRWSSRTTLLPAVLAFGFGVAVPMAAAQSDGLRPLADASGLNFGAAVTLDELTTDPAYRRLVIDNVNMVSTVDEVDFGVVQPQPGVFDFTRGDALVEFADQESIAVRGHGLIESDGLPDWLVGGTWTAETLSAVLRDHVTSVVGHFADEYPGVVTQWDVVDDAFLPDGTLRDNIWRQVIGDDYIRIAFDAARAADPDAELFYDDFFDDLSVTQDAVNSGAAISPGATAERSSCDDIPKCVGVRGTISGLVDSGVPIDGIGLQSRLLSPEPVDLATFTTWIDELGLRWAVTEFDVPLPTTEIANPESLAFQADTYAKALGACIDSTSCDTFITWGITDRLPPEADVTGGSFGGALWVDTADAPKPAFDAMAAEFGPLEPVTATTAAAQEPPTSPPTTDPAETGSDDDSTVPGALIVGVGALALVGVTAFALRRRASGDPSP
jgi:endo-1,4-beta-xylanase